MPIPLSQIEAEPNYGASPQGWPVRLASAIGPAIGRQVVLIALTGGAIAARLLWMPLALLTIGCGIVSVVCWNSGDWNNALTMAGLAVGCLAVMAGLRWVAGACIRYGSEGPLI